MPESLASIAEEAFSAVAAEITGIIFPASLYYETQGEFDPATGSYAVTPTTVTGGRALFNTETRAVEQSFPSYTVVPGDTMVTLEGFSVVPKVGWWVRVETLAGTRLMTIKAVADIMEAGQLFNVIAADG